MAFSYPHFDIEVERSVALERLFWPEPGEAMDERSLGCNRSYLDLRRLPWREAKRVYFEEGEYISRIEDSPNPDAEYDRIQDELYEDPEGLYGLDIGVASTVAALSAARCIPFSSCNGGAFGGSHHEVHPLVALFARPEAISLLLECAERTEAGLSLAGMGGLIVYADDIRNMRNFARAIIARSTAFRHLRFSRGRGRNGRRASKDHKQLALL